MSSQNHVQLTIVRKINAPVSLVFEALTNPEHLRHWWGPAECTLEVLQLDVTPGGRFHYEMKFPNGMAMYGIFKYREVDVPNKLVFTNSFADQSGNIIAAPIPEFPKEVLNTWTFEEHEGGTLLTLVGIPLSELATELQGYANMHGSMNEGFNKTFNKLDEYLKVQMQLRVENKQKRMPRVSTYLNFPGKTEEAMLFYKQVFNGQFVGDGLQRFGDFAPFDGQPEMSDEDKQLIIHAELEILNGYILMATDAPESMGFKLMHGNNMHINVEPDSRAEATRLFNELSAGGVITMPLQDMFWGAYFGSFSDKYGINWMINYTEK